MNYYTPAPLYDQLTNFFLIVHGGSPLNLAKDPSATLHPQSGIVCLLIQGSPPPPIPLSAISRQSSLHSLPVLDSAAHSDCRRLRFSVTADFVRLTNYYIIIIIIIIIIYNFYSLNIFMKNWFMTKSSDEICDLFKAQASSPLHTVAQGHIFS